MLNICQHITGFRPDLIYRHKLGCQFSLLSLPIPFSCYPFLTCFLYTPLSLFPSFLISLRLLHLFPMYVWNLFPPTKDRLSSCGKRNGSNERSSFEFHYPKSKAPSSTPFCKIHIRIFGVDCYEPYIHTWKIPLAKLRSNYGDLFASLSPKSLI